MDSDFATDKKGRKSDLNAPVHNVFSSTNNGQRRFVKAKRRLNVPKEKRS